MTNKLANRVWKPLDFHIYPQTEQRIKRNENMASELKFQARGISTEHCLLIIYIDRHLIFSRTPTPALQSPHGRMDTRVSPSMPASVVWPAGDAYR